MCGIAGIHAYRVGAPRVDRAELLAIRDHMSARGPDSADLWISEDALTGLAHLRLAIIDLSPGGEQPMCDPETGNWIVFNGEIYNHAELREELKRDGVAVRSHSDTEVLLKLFARRGVAMFDALRGMYAFAIWSPHERELFLARDPFGIKPLYYADDGRNFRFASQVKALLRGRVDTTPEPAGHAGFFLWGSVPEPFTLYRGIRALPAGHWMRVSATDIGQPQPFDGPLQRLRAAQVARAAAVPAAIQLMASAVQDSVRAHMVADVPVGVFLSAGLDSTMIAAAASSLGSVQTLTLGFEEYRNTVHDETGTAAEVAEALGTSHTTHLIRGKDFADDCDRILAAMDQPSIDGVNTWFVAKAAKQQGLKVALSGLGGDELFGSYPSFRQVPRMRTALAFFANHPRIGRAVRYVIEPLLGRSTSPKYAGLLEYGGSLGGAYLLRRALFMPWEIARLMDHDMAREGLETLNTLACLRNSVAGLESDRLAVSALEMQWYMRNQLLRDADWAGMAHSLEIRVPLVDMRLLGALRELDGVPPAVEKRLIARSVASSLPSSLWTRPKTGFSIPTQRWLMTGRNETVGKNREWAKFAYAANAAS